MGRSKRHRTYPEENTDKEKALRQKIKQQEAEIKRLKQELKTLNKAFEKTSQYIKGNTDNVTVEKMIAAAKQEKTMVEIKKENVCPECAGDIKLSKLPFGKMSICVAGCGWREVVND
jgi:uncharacterized protein (DUF342 family)